MPKTRTMTSMIGPVVLVAVVAGGPVTATAQTYDDIDAPILLVAPPEGVLLNTLRENRSSVQTFTRDGGTLPSSRYVSGLPYGAAPDRLDALAFVRTEEPLPPLAISPFEPVDEVLVDELQRRRPWIRRGSSILEDLRAGRRQWLRENGYILSVRTHVNERARAEAEPAPIRLELPAGEPEAAAPRTDVEERPDPQLRPGSIVRVRVVESPAAETPSEERNPGASSSDRSPDQSPR